MSGLSGGCACGSVRFETTGAPRFAFACHCAACRRRLTGTGHSVAAAFTRDMVRVTGKAQAFTRDSDSGHKVDQHFCATCGTPLWNTMTRAEDMMMVNLGALDDPAAVTPDRVFHEADAAHWDHVSWHDYS